MILKLYFIRHFWCLYDTSILELVDTPIFAKVCPSVSSISCLFKNVCSVPVEFDSQNIVGGSLASISETPFLLDTLEACIYFPALLDSAMATLLAWENKMWVELTRVVPNGSKNGLVPNTCVVILSPWTSYWDGGIKDGGASWLDSLRTNHVEQSSPVKPVA